MLSGQSNGMQIMDNIIEQYYRDDLITGHEAYMKALEKERFEAIRDDS